MGYVLNVKDVLSDAHNTFIRGGDVKDLEQEKQIEDILKKDKAFNWSDEDFPDDSPSYKESQGFTKKTEGRTSSSADLVLKKGIKNHKYGQPHSR